MRSVIKSEKFLVPDRTIGNTSRQFLPFHYLLHWIVRQYSMVVTQRVCCGNKENYKVRSVIFDICAAIQTGDL